MKMNDYEYDTTLSNAMRTLGDAFDISSYNGYNSDVFLQMFIASNCATFFENNHPRYVVGMSGYELFYTVLNNLNINKNVEIPVNSYSKSQFYWAGYFLAYFQRRKAIPFREISLHLTMSDLLMFYQTLHTVSNEYAYEEANKYYEQKQIAKLKEWRKYRGLTQNQLAFCCNLSKESIKSYELGVNKVYNARYDTVHKLSQTLHCKPEEIADYPISWNKDNIANFEQILSKMQTRTLQLLNNNKKNMEAQLNNIEYQNLYQNIQNEINQSIMSLQYEEYLTYKQLEDKLINHYHNQVMQSNVAISKKVALHNEIKSWIAEGIGMYLKLSGQKESSIVYDTAMLFNSKNVTEALFRVATLVIGLTQ